MIPSRDEEKRTCASGVYISRLLKSAHTESVIPVMANAVAAFYRYGKTDTAGGVMFDKLFVSEIPGYEHNSNRLDMPTSWSNIRTTTI